MKGKELRIRLVNTLVKHGIVDEKDAEKAFEEAMDKEMQGILDIFLEVFNGYLEQIERQHKLEIERLEKEIYVEKEGGDE